MFLLIGCGNANTPTATAQRFADAVVREDYRAARALFDQTLSEGDVTTMIASVRGDMVDTYGDLQSATVRIADATTEGDEALIFVTWRLAQADVVNVWMLRQSNNEWRVVTVWPVGQEVGRLQPDGVFATMTPVPSPTPAPTPQPTARDLSVRVDLPQQEGMSSLQTQITIVETGQQQTGLGGVFSQLPLGTYTVRLEVFGREPTETQVTLRGDQPPPNPLLLAAGDPIPFDVETSFFLTAGQVNPMLRNQFRLHTVGASGLMHHWDIESFAIPALSDDKRSMRFFNAQGIGDVDASGHITWLWEKGVISQVAIALIRSRLLMLKIMICGRLQPCPIVCHSVGLS
jgi:hypothetical protein